MLWLLNLALLIIVNAQPDSATLRPTLSPTTMMMMTNMPTPDSELSSGEPPRIVVVSVGLALMIALTAGGVYVIAYGEDDDEREYKTVAKQSQLW